jgi:hypothetical protein
VTNREREGEMREEGLKRHTVDIAYSTGFPGVMVEESLGGVRVREDRSGVPLWGRPGFVKLEKLSRWALRSGLNFHDLGLAAEESLQGGWLGTCFPK